MKTNSRTTKINDEIKRELADIFRSEIKDPRILDIIISVTKVETTTDLKISKVYVSVFGKSDEEKKEIIEVLNKSAGFIRKEIARRINLRLTPEFSFYNDDSIEYAMKMEKLIAKATKNTKRDE